MSDPIDVQIKDEFIEHRNHERADRVHHAIAQADYLEGNPAQAVRDLVEDCPDLEGVMPEEKTLAMAIGDVVADLMHLAQREGLDWPAILAQATRHFTAEQTEP